jgi:hypothetical protein
MWAIPRREFVQWRRKFWQQQFGPLRLLPIERGDG